MTTEEKNELNKQIKKYDGSNSFILSLQKQLKTSKFLSKEVLGNKSIKVLSIAQYEAAKSILD